ncbi:MAG: SIS domain-containing protein [Sediminibacterium sp.]
MSDSLLSRARAAIINESAALAAMAHRLDEHFERTVREIHAAGGRLVVSGIGKSALVGRKIVATLNSTGTPALFMHAADAIHGDLGMIQSGDQVLLISKSGESPEIKTLVPLIKKYGFRLIGMTGQLNSFLARESDWVLDTTIDKEACPPNLAPTTSTTAQMVMGDVLAICLMELSGFTGNDFARFHPGGNLGKRLLLLAGDIAAMHSMPRVLPEASLREVIVEITQKRLGVTAVVNNTDHIVGIITDGDLRRMLEKQDDISKVRAEDIMTKDPKTVGPAALASEALEMMQLNDISQLIVADGGKYGGIVHLHDLVKEGIL